VISFYARWVGRGVTIVADTTVQEKAIRYPTDARLYSRVIEHCRRINQEEGLPMRQSYVRTVPKLMRQSFYAHHPKRCKKAGKALKRLKTIAGRMVRELERNLSAEMAQRYAFKLEIFNHVLAQTRQAKTKSTPSTLLKSPASRREKPIPSTSLDRKSPL